MATKYWISTSSASFTTAANWSDGTAPANGDTLIFNSLGTAPCTSSLTTSLTGLTIYIDSGAPQVGNISGATRTPLLIYGGTVYIGRDPTGTGAGVNFAYIQNMSNAMTATVLSSSSAGLVNGVAPVVFEGPLLTVNATGGTLAIAPIDGTTASGIVNVSVGNGTPSMLIGTGATISTLTASGGTITSLSDNTYANIVLANGASFKTLGASPITAITVGTGSTFTHWGSGTITTLNLAGLFDRTGDTRAVTITNLNIENGSTLLMDNGKASSITRTTTTLSNCAMQDFTLTLPIGEKL